MGVGYDYLVADPPPGKVRSMLGLFGHAEIERSRLLSLGHYVARLVAHRSRLPKIRRYDYFKSTRLDNLASARAQVNLKFLIDNVVR